jgi:hypothetical protein
MIATLIVLAPAWLFWAHPAGWIFLFMWTLFVVPLALRHIWSRTRQMGP